MNFEDTFNIDMSESEFVLDDIIPLRPKGNNDYETGLTRDERYLINKRRSEIINKMDGIIPLKQE